MNEFDPDRPCQQRCGLPVHQVIKLCVPLRDGSTLISIADREDGERSARQHLADGRLCVDRAHPYDLVNIPEKGQVEAWAVVFQDGRVATWSTLAYAKEHAARHNKSSIVIRLTGEYER